MKEPKKHGPEKRETLSLPVSAHGCVRSSGFYRKRKTTLHHTNNIALNSPIIRSLPLGLSLRFVINNYNNIESLVYGRKATTATLLTTTNHNKIRSRVECQKTEVKWRPMACFSLESSPPFPLFRQFV